MLFSYSPNISPTYLQLFGYLCDIVWLENFTTSVCSPFFRPAPQQLCQVVFCTALVCTYALQYTLLRSGMWKLWAEVTKIWTSWMSLFHLLIEGPPHTTIRYCTISRCQTDPFIFFYFCQKDTDMQARVQTKPHKYIMINMRQITITGCLMDLLWTSSTMRH